MTSRRISRSRDGSGAAGGVLLRAVRDAPLAGMVAAGAGGRRAGVALPPSGALPAEALAPLRGAGSSVGGFHPLRAFARPLPSLGVARRTFFALDGDAT